MSALLNLLPYFGGTAAVVTVVYRLISRTERDYTNRVAPPPAPPMFVVAPDQPRRRWW